MAITFANDELVARAWLHSLGLTNVGTTLPQNQATWSTDGFVQITVTGDSSHTYYRLRRPVITAVCWAVNPAKQTPPWGKACDLAETISEGCWGFTPGVFSLSVTGAPHARTLQATVIQAPRRVFGDEAEYAKYTVDFELVWNTTD
ncbi:hypothetical protein OHS59_16220 [Streptomyces sp. NBC_00414]|uniref:hypothetical protein n=1 Tax=Streptomyces sp. NBC_00414 TaxID=2975739 RepID=UPI002E1F2B92